LGGFLRWFKEEKLGGKGWNLSICTAVSEVCLDVGAGDGIVLGDFDRRWFKLVKVDL
jgi:hypothetical protein